MKPGNENTEVTETVSKIGEAFDCKVRTHRVLTLASMMTTFVVIT